MDKTEAIQEISRRINVLKDKPVPAKSRAMLRGGMDNINQRRDITRYRKEIGKQKQGYTKQLSCLNEIDVLDKQEIELQKFIEPRLRRWF